MVSLPDTLEAAIAQSVEATQRAIASGRNRLQIEYLFPELKPMPVAKQYLDLLEQQIPDLGSQVKVFFSDAGAAALARRDWGETPYRIYGLDELLEPVQPEDDAFVIVAPTPVEIAIVEKITTQSDTRPCIFLNPKFQDVAIIGIGYAGRQLRERFLSTLESCYCLRPLDQGAVFRAYPQPWQVWWEVEEEYKLLSETPERPTGEELDQIIAQAFPAQTKKGGLLQELQQFLKALSQ
ncbi:MAG: DUF1995 family protein [Thermosynechococcaceae cyanobacterium MS004]|nr:DUF1995 family protein [Thermosynechococcaceae cyanobacterium MS004]